MTGLYTIAFTAPFLEILATGLEEHYPDTLAKAHILLPNRRSCRRLEEILRARGHRLLPRISSITDLGQSDEAEHAISPLEQTMLLARLIEQWQKHHSDHPLSLDQATHMALELSHFLHEVETAEVPFDQLTHLVPHDYASHWQQTLSFLEIISEHWPAILREKGKTSPASYRRNAIHTIATEWQKHPPAHPIIAAGINELTPAITRLLHTISTLPEGVVIMPAPVYESEEQWHSIDALHPYWHIKHVFDTLSLHPQNAPRWAGQEHTDTIRTTLLHTMMQPAALSHRWQEDVTDYSPTLSSLHSITTRTIQEESQVIALILKDTLEHGAKTCLLVTADRTIARRVSLLMQRWDITVDDSAGYPLLKVPAAAFMMLILEAFTSQLAPVPLLSLLKHPFLSENRIHAQQLERLVLRGVRIAEGFTGLYQALSRYEPVETEALLTWLHQLEAQCQAFSELFNQPRIAFRHMLEQHIHLTQTLAGATPLWEDETGLQLHEALTAILQVSDALGMIEPGAYAGILHTLLSRYAFRPRYGTHPHVMILSPQEAWLQSADRVIIAGCNENTWPEAPHTTPWMNRAMRKRFGLPAAEESIGQAASIFMQLMGNSEIFLTRSKKNSGKPTIPSRWLLRLETILKGAGQESMIDASAIWRAKAALLSKPEQRITLAPPAPTPPVALRPTELYVTQIEKLMRDPYSIYASHILALKPLAPLDQDPSMAEFGTFIHRALDQFITRFATYEPEYYLRELMRLGQYYLQDMANRPAVLAFWMPRFERIAQWFVTNELARRPDIHTLYGECKGSLTLGTFTLKARADRIERTMSGEAIIIDYKTGTVPEEADIKLGFASQMVLEALIAEGGGFAGLPKDITVTGAEHWKLSGGETAGVIRPIKDITLKIEEAHTGLAALIACFNDPATPYLCEPWPEKAPAYSDYRHLARVKEWGLNSDN